MNNNQMSEQEKKEFITLQNDKLLKAIERKSLEKMKKAIKNGASITINNYPLYHACEYENIDAINLLIDNGCLIQTTENDILKKMIMLNRFNIAEILIEKGGDLNFDNGKIFEIVIEKNHISGFNFLIKNNANIQINNNKPLTVAVLEKNFPLIKKLLSNGADIELGNDGPFVAAIKMEIVKDITEKNTYYLEIDKSETIMHKLHMKIKYGVNYLNAMKKIMENDKEINILQYLIDVTPNIEFKKIEDNQHIPEEFKKTMLSTLLENKLSSHLKIKDNKKSRIKI